MKIPATIESLSNKLKPLEVKVTHSYEAAISKFRMIVQKEGILQLFKKRQRYQKPSVKKKMKSQEAQRLKLIQENKERMIASGEWELRQKKRAEKRQDRLAMKKLQRNIQTTDIK